jgi:hypothetical protein
MPVQIVYKNFVDSVGTNSTFYRCNAGDKVNLRMVVKSVIQTSTATAGTSFVLNPIDQIVTASGSINFLTEGFRNGDYVQFTKYSQFGGVILSWLSIVTLVTSNELQVSFLPAIAWVDPTLGEFMQITSLHIGYGQKRESLVMDLNHVANGSAGSSFSLIDGETTRFTANLQSLTTTPQTMVQVGNRSGQFDAFVEIKDYTFGYSGILPANSNTLYFQIDVKIIQSGIYNQSNFDFSNCLKFISNMRFQRILGEPSNNFICSLTDDADTGWFNEAYNTGIPQATLIQGVSELAFDSPTTFQVVIDSSSSSFGIGSSYIPDNELYYKSKAQSQSELGMTISTNALPLFTPIFSPLNPVGAGYSMEIISFTSVGTIYTIDVVFTPNANLNSFIDSCDEGDRLFRIWFKFGNINLLVFDGQMISNPPIGGELKMKVSTFLDHSENVTDSSDFVAGYSADIEDDLSYIGKFILPLNDNTIQSFTARIEALNSVTGESFTLQNAFFNIASIPFVGGKYILNQSQPIITTLPNTSVKRNALLVLDSSVDEPSYYGVKIYFPFLYRWEYWLQQLNADVDFYPNDQTKDWFEYGNHPDWNLNLHLELVKGGLAYIFDDIIDLKNYDANDNITSNIELFIDSTNQNVGIVTEGLLMRVVGTHELVDGTAWNQSSIWGMLTIEPKESAPRWICSTIVPTDFNSLNPLSPLSGALCDLTFPTPTIARMECFFNPDKINLSNGVKFTTKIKGCSEFKLSGKLKSDGTVKMKTDGTIKQKSLI